MTHINLIITAATIALIAWAVSPDFANFIAEVTP
jgi:hypothetical protein